MHSSPVACPHSIGDMSANYFSSFSDPFQRQKDIQLQAWTRTYDSRNMRLIEHLDSLHMKVVNVVSLKHRPLLHPGRYPWYLFLLEVELTPRP